MIAPTSYTVMVSEMIDMRYQQRVWHTVKYPVNGSYYYTISQLVLTEPINGIGKT